MAEYVLPLVPEGAVTAPAGAFKQTIPSAESVTYLDIGEMNALEIAEFGWVMADGAGPMRSAVQGSIYNVGGLAPAAAPTLAAGGATRATVVGTYTGQPADAETLVLGLPGNTFTVTWKTTLQHGGSAPANQVAIGVDANTSYTNLQNLINETGLLGTDYLFVTPLNYIPGATSRYADLYDIECSALNTGAGTITMRYTIYGELGNTVVSTSAVTNFSWASATFTGGVEGSAAGPSAGNYRYFTTFFREADGAETGRSPYATIKTLGNWAITVTPPAASADTTFDYVNIYRTAKKGVAFYLAGALPRALGGPLTDSMTDLTLVRSQQWNESLHRDYTEGMPPRGRALALFKDRVWTIGAHKHADYVRGEVGVTNDSATISFFKAGTATALQGVTEQMVGRTFSVTGTSETYRILSVSESAATAVIDRVYEGSTDAHVGFAIKDDYDANMLRASVAFLPNQWPVDQSPGRIETDDIEGGTALLATDDRLFAFSRTSIMSLTGLDLESWDANKVAQNVGCVGPRMVVGVEGGGAFLSEDGFWFISPSEALTSISSPKTPKGAVAQGIDGTIARIAWANVDQGYMTYDKTDRVLVAGVPLDGAVTPNYEIVFDMQNATWALYKRAEWSALANITLPGGGHALLSGDREGWLWHANIGESDGFYGTEAVQTLTAATASTLTASGTPFSTSEGGKPVLVFYADGKTVGYGKVASSTTSVLTLAEDLATAPAANDQIVLGGIAWQAKSGFTTFGEEYRKKNLRSVTVRHSPTTRGNYFFSFAVDGGDFQLCPRGTSAVDLAQKNGKKTHKTNWPGDSHAINLRGFTPGGRATIRGGVFDLVIRENERG